MKIYVLSDSHNSFLFQGFIEQAQEADVVIHCGDGTRDQEDLKSVMSCPVYCVKGNCDYSGIREGFFELSGHGIFVTHGDAYGVEYSQSGLITKAKALGADIVLYGHTHVPDISYRDNIWLINPGSLTRPRCNKVATYCILELDGEKVNARLVEYK